MHLDNNNKTIRHTNTFRMQFSKQISLIFASERSFFGTRNGCYRSKVMFKLTPMCWSDGNFFLTTFILFLAQCSKTLKEKSGFPSIDTAVYFFFVCVCLLFTVRLFVVVSKFFVFYFCFDFRLWALEKEMCVCYALEFHFGW